MKTNITQEKDSRLPQAIRWLKKLGHNSPLLPLAGDASFRQYWRLNDGEIKWVLMDAPPPMENINTFVSVANIFRHNSAWRIPEITHTDSQNGFALIEDFGDHLLEKHYRETSVTQAIQKVLDSLIGLHTLDISKKLPDYREADILSEMDLFDHWFVQKHCLYQLNQEQQQTLLSAKNQLTDNFLDQPQVMVHRDFHCRNIFWETRKHPRKNQATIGVIDFQDAVNGPICYDSVSLLKDCYWELDDQIRNQLLYQHWLQLNQTDIALPNWLLFQRQFDLTGIQRHLKILGVFCRLYYRDDKPGYLPYLNLTLRYLQQTVSRYKEFKHFHQLLLELEKKTPTLKI